MNLPRTLPKLSSYLRVGSGKRVNSIQRFHQLSTRESLDLLNKKAGNFPTDVCLSLLEKCRQEKDLVHAKHVYTLICDEGRENDPAVGNRMVSILVECGDLINAELVLNRLTSRNVYSWTSIIFGFLKCGNTRHALKLYEKMIEDGLYPNAYTLAIVLKICGCDKDMEKGQQTHFEIIKVGYEKNVFIGTSLMDMYIKCGSVSYAQQVFDNMLIHNVVSWNVLATGYAEHGPFARVFECFKQMVLEKISPDDVTFLCGLKVCRNLRMLREGQRLHEELIKNGFELDGVVGHAVIDMYAKCNTIDEAGNIFDKLPNRNVVSWNTLISGYIENGFVDEAIKYFEQMQIKHILPDAVTFMCGLKAYWTVTSVEGVQKTHMKIVEMGFEGDNVVGNTLIDAYFKCDFLEEAQMVFNKQPICNVVSWNVLIAGYVESGCSDLALQYFEDMKMGIVPDVISFVSILKCCANVLDIVKGRELHEYMLLIGLNGDIFLSNIVIDMYAKCGFLVDAQKIFDELSGRDVVSWTSLLAGYCEHMPHVELFSFLDKMKMEGILLDPNILSCLLKICSNLQFLEKGLDIHSEAIKKGFEKDAFLSIAIVDMYAKCDLLQDAKCVYDMLPTRDVFVLNALLSGYVEFGSIYQLEECLNQIEIEGLLHDSTTFALVVKICGKCENVRMGQDLYRKIVKIGLDDDVMIIINLTEMYVKYALTVDAQKVADNLPSAAKNKLWTSIKIAFKENEPIDQALGFFNQMQFEHISQSPADCACILKACSATKDVLKGQDLHTQIVQRGFDMDLSVSSTLVDMYAKCGSLTDAHELFDKLTIRDVVSWNIIIAGYVEENAFQEALHLFSQMQKEGIAPSSVTSICILKACGSMGIVEKGNQIHKDVVCKGFDDDLVVGNKVIDMYVKCGLVSDAHEVFTKLSVRDIASWNSMIAGYGINHDTRSAVQAFEAMQCDKSVVPDATTFICLLSACSRGSLVDEGHKYFRMMGEVYGIVPAMDHWNCIVDLFARAGDMHEAMKIIGVIGPYSSLSRDMLTALLTACRTCSQVDLGLKCFEQLAQIEKGDSTVDRIHRKS